MCDGSALKGGPVIWNKWGDCHPIDASKFGGWSVAIYAKTKLKKLWVIALLSLAGCGVNGAPERPVKAGITISGEAAVGIAKNGT